MPRRTRLDPALAHSDERMRATVEMKASTYASIFLLTRKYKLAIPEVIEVLVKVAEAHEDVLHHGCEMARLNKLTARAKRKELISAMSKTPDHDSDEPLDHLKPTPVVK